MVHILLHTYHISLGLIAGVGLVYLLYLHVFVFGYRHSFNVLVAGLLLFVVGGPIMDFVQPTFTHFIHGFGALLAAIGLYGSVYKDLKRQKWVDLLLQNPRRVRRHGKWMTPMDMEILELLDDSSLVLSPTIIAINLDYSREAVNRRLTELDEHGHVDRVARGKYRITPLGDQYLNLAPETSTPITDPRVPTND